MENLLAASAAFLLTHFVTSTPLRPALVKSLGQRPYLGLYSLVSFVTLGWMIWAYRGAPRDALWPALPWLPLVVMPCALVLIVCGYGRNPTMVGAEKLLKSDHPARGMIRITRHPLMWGLMLFSAAHILARGDVRATIFFGTLFLVAGIGTLLMDFRKRTHPDFKRFEALTSNIPFLAVAQGRNRVVWREIGWARPAVGLAAFGVLLLLHRPIFGTAPY